MKTVTGLFDDYSDASAAVSALEARGIHSDNISIVSNNADGRYKDGDHDSNAAEGAGTGAGIGAVVGGAGGLLTGLGIMAIPGAKDSIDEDTFEQILEMDDDDDREFSKSIVYDFFTQAQSTFEKMDANLEKKDLKTLSELGHFLKGSSATLGLSKVKDSCEKIQNYGLKKDAKGDKDITEEEGLKKLDETIKQAKTEFEEVKKVLKKFYDDES